MSSLSTKEHTVHRRRVAEIYSKSKLHSSAHLKAVTSSVLNERLLPLITESFEKTGSMEVLELNVALGVDFIVAYLFGLSSGVNFLQNVDQRKLWLKNYSKSHTHDEMVWIQEAPTLTRFLASVWPSSGVKSRKQGEQYLNAWCLERCAAAEQLLSTAGGKQDYGDGTFPIAYHQLKTALEREATESGGFNDAKTLLSHRVTIASELLDHIGMGNPSVRIICSPNNFHQSRHETLSVRSLLNSPSPRNINNPGVTLSYMLLELSRQPELQDRLRQSLIKLIPPTEQDKPGSSRTIPSPKDLDSIPLLEGILKESLRLRPSHPEGQPRLIPHASNLILNGVTHIPPGTRVDAYSLVLTSKPLHIPRARGIPP